MMPACSIHALMTLRSARERMARGSSAGNWSSHSASTARGAFVMSCHSYHRVEPYGFGNEAGTERHGAAGRLPERGAQHGIEDEHHRGGGHVAVATQDLARGRERRRRKAERAFDRIENGAA